MEGAKAQSGVRKLKKKQVKDELDRMKQAEKKKRRLEKALATSAAIRSELEKKKEKKKEEQQRLDEEGAAIAEAVALHVLHGEDSEDSRDVMLKKDEGSDLWDHGRNLDIFMGGGRRAVFPQQNLTKYSFEGTEWVARNQTFGWKEFGNQDWMASYEPRGRDLYQQYYGGGNWDITGISPQLIAEQAFSSLQIAEDAHVGTYIFNQVLRG
ncbi:uncharacterized protein LOC115998690 [Ipomoea triloba]|uniref:uncharacterized protein LOC115998690 n=1 Tax=Ipomoea triloba TaxID=35885 RepID=UPI00125D052E|nr:uncharacterized protein LOC115998690 [Ipomoea triloba]XP_031094182.1 uncharacterized protein LOC115998690 [Ipomoea triloba]